MERREISVGLGVVKLPGGRKIEAHIIRYNEGVIPSHTADHETDQGLVAEMTGSAVDVMTIIPGPGYDGMTSFKSRRLNAASAAAAAARRRKGTGWDKYITIAHGYDWESAKATATGVLDANHDVHGEISKELEVQKSLTSEDIWRVIDRTRNPELRVVEFDNKGREIRSSVMKARKGEAVFIEVDNNEEENKEDRPYNDKITDLAEYRKDRLLSAEAA